MHLRYLRRFQRCVDLFVRSWVEIGYVPGSSGTNWSTSSWGRELKCLLTAQFQIRFSSTSSWGRELKWTHPRSTVGAEDRRPLREVVSWNVSLSHFFLASWRRPLREVVSWNILCPIRTQKGEKVDLFVRSWVEMSESSTGIRSASVDLFVRSWVEISSYSFGFVGIWSTSSWGRELK